MYFYFSKILAPFLNPTNLLFFILVFFYLIYLKGKIKFRFLPNIIFLFLIILSFFPVGNLGLKYLEKDFILQNKISKVDNIVVLAGSENLISSTITKKLNLNGSSERLISSVKLALDYPNSTIYYMGGDGYLIKNEINEVDVAKTFYTNIGFDLNRIKFIYNTRNTIENLKAFKKNTNQNQSNILITSAFHMKRSMLIADELNLIVEPYAVDFRSVNNFKIINYYQEFSVANNLSSFDIFSKELIGILAFKLFY